MIDVCKEIINSLLDYEKQYKIILINAIVYLITIFSKDNFNNVKTQVINIFKYEIPKIYNILIMVSSDTIIYDISKMLLIFSSICVVLFFIIIICQLICDKFIKEIEPNAFQYNFDLFGKLAITSVHIYILLLLIVRILWGNNKQIYFPSNDIWGIGLLPGVLSSFMILGIFLYGVPKKTEDNKEKKL
jgi:hypothetical protein